MMSHPVFYFTGAPHLLPQTYLCPTTHSCRCSLDRNQQPSVGDYPGISYPVPQYPPFVQGHAIGATLNAQTTRTFPRCVDDKPTTVATSTTSFYINDILQVRRQKTMTSQLAPLIRPWDSDSGGRGTDHEGDDDDDSDDDGDIEVDVVKATALNSSTMTSQCPLSALLSMANQRFDVNGDSGDGASSDGKDNQSTKSHSSNKRKRKSRTAFTNQQIHELERRFLLQKYVTATDRDQIAESLGMTSGQVITWFQNRRAKLKRDLEELKADVTAAQTAALDTDPVATSGAIASTERRSGSISHLEKLICNTNSENKSTSRDT